MRTLLTTLALILSFPFLAQTQIEGRFAGSNIVVGLEYQTLDNERFVKNVAAVMAETNLTGFKHFVEVVQWGAMQRRPDASIDFTKLDWFVHEYQKNGFTELTISLKSHSKWGSIDMKGFGTKIWGTNPTPKPEHMSAYKNWVRSVVERYDADGLDDMPGLRWPVRYIEIGNEFSSFEPQPVDYYLKTLEAAYKAAHEAYDDVRVAHVAFLITPVNMDVDDPSEYDLRWKNTFRRDTHHDIHDMRVILDNPQWFDVLNFHNLGDPYEIEDIVKWLNYETGKRGYSKEMIISDTTPTSYIGWGPAVSCVGPKEKLGIIGRPATEADRCRLAKYFSKLANGDKKTLDWTRGFIASDHVQRTIVAAEQEIKLINLAFVGDIPVVSWKIGKAGAGISGWAGTIDANIRKGEIKEKYATYYAIRQMMNHIHGYTSIKRLDTGDDRIRLYEVRKKSEFFWVAWQNPKAAITPIYKQKALQLKLRSKNSALVEPVIVENGKTEADNYIVTSENGVVSIDLYHQPVYIFPQQ